MEASLLAWAALSAAIIVMLAVDLVLFARGERELALREAGAWSVILIAVALAFGAGLWVVEGSAAAGRARHRSDDGSDLAIDSITATFAITFDSFIVFAGNAFALLGLRALYFLLVGLMARFVYLTQGLAVILVFVGAKMLLTDVWKVPLWLSLAFIAFALLMTALLSERAARRLGASPQRPSRPSAETAADALPAPMGAGEGRA